MMKLIKLLALAGMMAGLLAVAPNVNAHGGDPQPSVLDAVPAAVDATCGVSGEVTTPPGDPQTIGHTDYQFNQTTILACTDVGTANVVNYRVHARGSAWGPLQAGVCDPSAHNIDPVTGTTCEGSATARSWSDEGTHLAPGHKYRYPNHCGDSDNTNKNHIEATDPSGDTYEGWVKFDRVGPEVVAWGEFCVSDGEGTALLGVTFTAELLFTPTGLDDGGEKTGDEPRTLYTLNGVATIDYP